MNGALHRCACHRNTLPISTRRAARRRSTRSTVAPSATHDEGAGRTHQQTLPPPAMPASWHETQQQRHQQLEEDSDSEDNVRSPRRFTRKFSKRDYDTLPHRIVMVRHAESMGNVEKDTYCTNPDHKVCITETGKQQALKAGQDLCKMLKTIHGTDKIKLFFMTSPYCRTIETTDLLLEAFTEKQIVGVRSAVQLREQDFGNFQDPERISRDMTDRIRFGRFWFRFPNGESGADVYDRVTIFEDHLTRDMLMGRFQDATVVLVTHGLTLRLLLMRWFHWNVDEMLRVYNPGNCVPIVLEKLPWEVLQELQNNRYVGVKQCYAITPQSFQELRGCTRVMASYLPRNLKDHCAKASWKARSAQERGCGEEPPPIPADVSGNWLYGYYCSVPPPGQNKSNSGDAATQSYDEADWAQWVSRQSFGGAAWSGYGSTSVKEVASSGASVDAMENSGGASGDQGETANGTVDKAMESVSGRTGDNGGEAVSSGAMNEGANGAQLHHGTRQQNGPQQQQQQQQRQGAHQQSGQEGGQVKGRKEKGEASTEAATSSSILGDVPEGSILNGSEQAAGIWPLP